MNDQVEWTVPTDANHVLLVPVELDHLFAVYLEILAWLDPVVEVHEWLGDQSDLVGVRQLLVDLVAVHQTVD